MCHDFGEPRLLKKQIKCSPTRKGIAFRKKSLSNMDYCLYPVSIN